MEKLEGKRVLVFGASGTQGGAVARAVAAAGATVLGASRTGARSPAGRPVRMDLNELTDELRAVADGVDGAFVHLPLAFGAPGDAERVGAVMQTLGERVGRVVFSASGPLPDEPVGMPFIDEKVAVTQRVRESGGVVLTATAFLENLSAPWSAPLVLRGELRYPRPAHWRAAWMTNRDVGAAVVGALAGDHAGRTYALAGPEVQPLSQVAAGLGAGLGRPVAFQEISGSDYGALMAPIVGPELAGMIGGFYEQMPPGDNPAFLLDGGPAARALGYTPMPVLRWARTEDWTAR
jgi:uncharacterized protein YbjT (DUF2867 family)